MAIEMIRQLLSKQVDNILKRGIDYLMWDPWVNRSWSQEGEDRILYRLFQRQATGFYVDVGAHHPKRFSNTYLFYKVGWCGLNIDAMPGPMRLFEKIRPRDINLETGIGSGDGEFDYYFLMSSH